MSSKRHEQDENQKDMKMENSASSSPDNLPIASPKRGLKIKLKFPIAKGVVKEVDYPHFLPINEPDNSASKDKKESPSRKRITKKEAHFQEQFGSKWRCERVRRQNGYWDKFYYHNETGVKCRSLPEIERYEKEGIVGHRKPKEDKRDNKKTQKGKRAIQHNFMEDAHIYHYNSCRDYNYSSDNSDRTPSPPRFRTAAIAPRVAPKV